MAKRRKRSNNFLAEAGAALDLMLAGHERVIGRDFIVERNKPLNPDFGHLDPKDLHAFDQDYINSLIAIEPTSKIFVPTNLKYISEEYTKQRALLSAYHHENDLIREYDIIAAKELQNFDPYINKVVIRNEAEMNAFYDYIILYRKIKGKRAIIHWGSNNLGVKDVQNKKVVDALEKAKFTLLRLDENLPHGAIKAVNIITQQETLLIDKALNASQLAGNFFVCSLLDMGEYCMTSGGGIPLNPNFPAPKSALTLFKNYLNNLKKSRTPINKNIMDCAREIYGFCLRGGALINMEVN